MSQQQPPTMHESGAGAPPTTYEGTAPVVTGRRRRLSLPDAILAEYEYLGDLSTSGAQADVVHCRRTADGLEVAIKLYRDPGVKLDRTTIAKLGDADPAHVVPILDFQTVDNEIWEVQEYFPNGSLADLIDGFPERKVPASVCRDILVELTDAIDHIHQRQIVHRDIKPHNVLIRQREPLDCVLADFGLATGLATSRAARSVAGTMAYLAPEASYGLLANAADWWALGVILHEALTGRHLFADPQTGDLLQEQQIRVDLNEGRYEVSGLPDERWTLLVRGLLTRQQEERWKADQVREWLAGGSPAVAVAAVEPERAARARQPFAFLDQTFEDPVALAAAFRAHPGEATTLLADPRAVERLRNWLRDAGVGDEADHLLTGSRPPDPTLLRLQLLIDPSSRPVYRGVELSARSLEEQCDRAVAGDAGAVAWIHALRSDQILSSWAAVAGGGTEIALADERLRVWWARIDNELGGHRSETEPARHQSEGVLLRAALSAEARTAIDSRVGRELRDVGGIPSWLSELAARARSADDSGALALRVVVANQVVTERAAAQAATQARLETERAEARAARQAAWVERRRTARRSFFRGAFGWAVLGLPFAVLAWVMCTPEVDSGDAITHLALIIGCVAVVGGVLQVVPPTRAVTVAPALLAGFPIAVNQLDLRWFGESLEFIDPASFAPFAAGLVIPLVVGRLAGHGVDRLTNGRTERPAALPGLTGTLAVAIYAFAGLLMAVVVIYTLFRSGYPVKPWRALRDSDPGYADGAVTFTDAMVPVRQKMAGLVVPWGAVGVIWVGTMLAANRARLTVLGRAIPVLALAVVLVAVLVALVCWGPILPYTLMTIPIFAIAIGLSALGINRVGRWMRG